VEAWAEEEESLAVHFQLGDSAAASSASLTWCSATRCSAPSRSWGGAASAWCTRDHPEGQAFAFKRLKKVADPGSAESEALRKEVQTLSAG